MSTLDPRRSSNQPFPCRESACAITPWAWVMFGKCPKRTVIFSSAFTLFAQRMVATSSTAIVGSFIVLVLEAECSHEVSEVGVRIGTGIGQVLTGEEMTVTDLRSEE